MKFLSVSVNEDEILKSDNEDEENSKKKSKKNNQKKQSTKNSDQPKKKGTRGRSKKHDKDPEFVELREDINRKIKQGNKNNNNNNNNNEIFREDSLSQLRKELPELEEAIVKKKQRIEQEYDMSDLFGESSEDEIEKKEMSETKHTITLLRNNNNNDPDNNNTQKNKGFKTLEGHISEKDRDYEIQKKVFGVHDTEELYEHRYTRGPFTKYIENPPVVRLKQISNQLRQISDDLTSKDKMKKYQTGVTREEDIKNEESQRKIKKNEIKNEPRNEYDDEQMGHRTVKIRSTQNLSDLTYLTRDFDTYMKNNSHDQTIIQNEIDRRAHVISQKLIHGEELYNTYNKKKGITDPKDFKKLSLPEKPDLNRSYFSQFLRESRSCAYFKERPCSEGRNCIAITLSAPINQRSINTSVEHNLREFLLPHELEECNKSGKLPERQKKCIFCYCSYVVSIYKGVVEKRFKSDKKILEKTNFIEGQEVFCIPEFFVKTYDPKEVLSQEYLKSKNEQGLPDLEDSSINTVDAFPIDSVIEPDPENGMPKPFKIFLASEFKIKKIRMAINEKGEEGEVSVFEEINQNF